MSPAAPVGSRQLAGPRDGRAGRPGAASASGRRRRARPGPAAATGRAERQQLRIDLPRISAGRTSKVVSAPIVTDWPRAPATLRLSSARAKATSRRAHRPEAVDEVVLLRLPQVGHRAAARAPPAWWSSPDRRRAAPTSSSGRSRPAHRTRPITAKPRGLPMSLASLASILLAASPIDTVTPTLRSICSDSAPGCGPAARRARAPRSEIEIGLVDRHLLDVGGRRPHQLADAARIRAGTSPCPGGSRPRPGRAAARAPSASPTARRSAGQCSSRS